MHLQKYGLETRLKNNLKKKKKKNYCLNRLELVCQKKNI